MKKNKKLKVLKKRVGGAAGREYGSPSGGISGASKGPAGGASAGGNYGGNRNPNQTYGGGGGSSKDSGATKTGTTRRTIGGPNTTKDQPYKSNTGINLIAGALVPGGGILAEGAQRKAYKDRQNFARKEGLYREYYIGNQFKADPSARVLKPNSPEGKAFIKEAKPASKPTLGGRDNGGGIPRCPDGTLPPCTKVASAPTLPMGKAKVEPKMFEFNFNQGGLVRGAGKILKDRNRKVRIF